MVKFGSMGIAGSKWGGFSVYGWVVYQGGTMASVVPTKAKNEKREQVRSVQYHSVSSQSWRQARSLAIMPFASRGVEARVETVDRTGQVDGNYI